MFSTHETRNIDALADDPDSRLYGSVRPLLTKLSDVESTQVDWLWPGRIPLGKLVLLDGDPGLGKSTLTLDLAARVTRGIAMPDGSPADVEGPAGVVLVSVEDDPSDTIRPRMDAAGADVSRVVLWRGVQVTAYHDGEEQIRERLPSLSDIEALRQAIDGVQARLVIVDPLMAFLDGDSHKDADVRHTLSPLAKLAAETGAAVIVVRHLNKSGGGNPLYRGGGSIGIIAAARVGMLVAKDPNDESNTRRILAVTKCNLSGPVPALAYRFDALDGSPRIVWEGATDHTPEALLAVVTDADERSALDEAKDWLREILAEGPVAASEALKQATRDGICRRTLDRARSHLGVRSKPSGFGGPRRWHLPRQSAPEPVSLRSERQAQKVAYTAKTEGELAHTGVSKHNDWGEV